MKDSQHVCAGCHRTMSERQLHGVHLSLCNHCRLVTMDVTAFEALALKRQPPPPPISKQMTSAAIAPTTTPSTRSSSGTGWGRVFVIVALATVPALILGSMIGLGTVGWFAQQRPTVTPDRVPVGREAVLPPLDVPDPEPPRTPSPPSRPSAPPSPVVTPPSAPRPEPKPEPEAVLPRSVPTLVSAGWKAFDRSPDAARGLFAEALAIQSSHPDANYGYGYALLKLGRASQAKPHLCLALGRVAAGDQREIRSLLERNHLSCDP